MTPREVMETAVKALDSKKAVNIKVIKTEKVTVLADYFVICSGTSSTHLKTLSEEVDQALSEAGEPPLRVEGHRGGTWVLVDFGSVIVHVFTDEARKFYNLERLWQDGEEIDVAPIVQPAE